MFARDVKFFEAWKTGVELAGVSFFGDGTKVGLNAAKSKNDMQPRIDTIKEAFSSMSPGEIIFLGAMVSFYNTHAGRNLLGEMKLTSDIGDLTRLDMQRRKAISNLIVSYAGW